MRIVKTKEENTQGSERRCFLLRNSPFNPIQNGRSQNNQKTTQLPIALGHSSLPSSRAHPPKARGRASGMALLRGVFGAFQRCMVQRPKTTAVANTTVLWVVSAARTLSLAGRYRSALFCRFQGAETGRSWCPQLLDCLLRGSGKDRFEGDQFWTHVAGTCRP